MSANRCRRLGPFLLVSLLLAQAALGIHKAGHDGTAQETPCPLCVTADHLSGPPEVNFALGLLDSKPPPVPVVRRTLVSTRFVSPYRSRAPPQRS